MDTLTRAPPQTFLTCPHYEGNSFDFEQYLSYNADKKRFSWNGTLEELESFVDTKLSRLIDDGDNGLKTKKSYNLFCYY